MRRTVLLLAALTLATAGLAVAQEDERANSLEAGSWALMFAITDNFTLTSFEGGSLSLKRHFSDKSALRAGIDVGFYDSESTRTSIGQQGSNANNYSFRLEGLYQRYTSPGRVINFYWGAGAYGTYSDRSNEQRSDSTVSSNETSYYSLGATGALGVEFFAMRAISLHAEYRASLGYEWAESVARLERAGAVAPENRREDSGWTLGNGVVRFGLSAYF